MNQKYICTYPFYTGFSAGSIYFETDTDETGVLVSEFVKRNPKHWHKI